MEPKIVIILLTNNIEVEHDILAVLADIIIDRDDEAAIFEVI